MFLKSKKNDKKNILDEPSSPSLSSTKIEQIETFNVLKNKNQWILLRENEERPIFYSLTKNVVVNKAKDFSNSQEFKVNIFNVNNELISSKILIKN